MFAASSMRQRTWTGSLPPYTSSAFCTQQIEQLGVAQGDKEIEGIVGIRHDDEQRCLAISQRVQLQLVIGSQVTQFLNVKGGQPRAAANQNRLSMFCQRQIVKDFFIKFTKNLKKVSEAPYGS